MKITYYGHSCVLVEEGGKRIIIDPFLSESPVSEISAKDIHVDAVLLTHGHSDHFGDCIEIAKANDCPVIAVFELAEYCQSQGVNAYGMNIGGSHSFDGFKVKYTLAFHTSSVSVGDTMVYAGEPGGILLTMGGKTFFHAGDTGLFGDMRLIGEMNEIDAAALPIGDFFTMGPDDALLAAKWLQADNVLPVHYNTFPVIKQDGVLFCERLRQEGIDGYPLQPGESFEI
ncbi:metal-dependent hydrolase [Paenibacillus sp.]|jgi:L-ascorbate metabolism protein UlaG (beta-lactamase superfamily)|uniref:metal-dependent hydrolase n=1 Tax=Paenibacillus sp. TaxID=58172 RepID=UPI002819AE2B|nr:metal-dependent hydrolase [Paenibacillus sp.]MDR0268339.1 metal-dependent hydrolase [Paenibacillus sp.]